MSFEDMRNNLSIRAGFALPTVLIASIVLLMVLTVSISSVVAIRTTLQTQYYEQLAKTAGEAGVAYAKACLAKNGNVPLWTDAKPLTPATDCAGNVLLTPALDILVVGGGGAGGGTISGGGGGGGVVEESGYAVTADTPYSVTVGAGGVGGRGWDNLPANGSSGGNSSFADIVAIGGGGGAGYGHTAALSGGSGGGGAYTQPTGASGTSGQGYAGGSHPSNNSNTSGGGGGAGGAGEPSTTTKSGDGGPGRMSMISGAVAYYGGGGGGGTRSGYGTIGTGGLGGGGNGTNSTAVAGAGAPNTGGGGGGAGYSTNSTAIMGGAGGTGVVIVRYPKGTLTATGGAKVDTGLYTVHTFTSSGVFNVSTVGTASCPTDPRCSVTVEDNLRSSFRVGLPTLDSEGKAVALPNTGYVELLRSSTGEVWRTYRQPSVQAAVVPGLCAGAATSSLGWSNATLAATQASLPNAPSARSIAAASGPVAAGQMYFRKDFVVSQSGTYNVFASTPSGENVADVYIDGSLVTTAQGTLSSATKTLTPGCHVATVKLTNSTVLHQEANFIASVQLDTDAVPIVATDTDWRVSTGSVVDFSNPDFYANPSIWSRVNDAGSAMGITTTWGSASGDQFTRLVTGPCNTSCPPSSYTYLRDGRDIVLTSSRTVRISVLCDDDCRVYVGGEQIITKAVWTSIGQQTVTLPAGTYRVAATLINSGSAANGSKFGMSMVDVNTGEIISRTDSLWQASNIWYAGTSPTDTPYAYQSSFLPSPLDIDVAATLDALVVAGGGGGGGNCSSCGGAGGGGGGGVLYIPGAVADGSVYTIAVGAGGASGPNSGGYLGGKGGNSQFGLNIAIGGGGGVGQTGGAAMTGGSGGGGSGGGSPPPGGGGAGTAGQGFAGGAGTVSPYGGGGGGGAGGPGIAAAGSVSGNGGPGLITYLDGTRRAVAGGGGGGTYGAAYTAGLGEPGSAGNGASGGGGGSAVPNSGSGGGGANGYPSGSIGGLGGSGIVILRYKKGTVTVTNFTGSLSYSSFDVTLSGVTYTVYRFTGGTGTVRISPVS